MKLKEVLVGQKFIYSNKTWEVKWVSPDGLEIKCISEGMASILPPDLIVELYGETIDSTSQSICS